MLIHHRSLKANIESLLKVELVSSLSYSPPAMKVVVVFFSLLKYLSLLNFINLCILRSLIELSYITYNFPGRDLLYR